MADQIKQVVADVLTETGLEVTELEHGLMISNPCDRDRGWVHVSYADAHVSWERVIWDHWGSLVGFAEADDNTTAATKIINTLTS